MKTFNKLFLTGICAILIAQAPVFAKINGSISQSVIYDNENTIMQEFIPNTKLKCEKYWEKNMFFSSTKYKPLFMLSNKELYKLMPEKKASTVERIYSPSVYNISLKTATIKSVELKPKKTVPNPGKNVVKSDTNYLALYENAKNPGVEIDEKIKTIQKLKTSNNSKNYVLALDLLDDVLRAEPFNAYAYYLKGEIYFAQKDSSNALKNYTEALKLNPTSKQSCLGIAKTLEPTNKLLAQKYYKMATTN